MGATNLIKLNPLHYQKRLATSLGLPRLAVDALLLSLFGGIFLFGFVEPALWLEAINLEHPIASPLFYAVVVILTFAAGQLLNDGLEYVTLPPQTKFKPKVILAILGYVFIGTQYFNYKTHEALYSWETKLESIADRLTAKQTAAVAIWHMSDPTLANEKANAVKWLTRAARLGSPNAKFFLADRFIDIPPGDTFGSPPEKFVLLEEAAMGGVKDAADSIVWLLISNTARFPDDRVMLLTWEALAESLPGEALAIEMTEEERKQWDRLQCEQLDLCVSLDDVRSEFGPVLNNVRSEVDALLLSQRVEFAQQSDKFAADSFQRSWEAATMQQRNKVKARLDAIKQETGFTPPTKIQSIITSR
jgi:hypothetical protein